jgi:wyosine [tRNA(Phe)-imidazoG37] synthetase (radical SAM superfamily)
VIRKEFFPPEEVIAELEPVLASRPHLDSVTFAGSGEPTLSLSIGEIIAWVKRKYPGYTVSVLTNGSLLPDADVRAELLSADRVIPTTIIEGMVQFRKQYSGALWLEVFVIPGINTTDPELEGLKEAIQRIDPDLIQLNSLDRPAAEPWVAAATDTELDRVRKALGETGIEIVGRNHPVSPATLAATEATDLIRATLSRRSSTVEDLVHTTGLSGGEVAKILGTLERAGEITSQRGTRGVFYLFKNPDAMEMR